MQIKLPSHRPPRDFTPVPRKHRVDGWTVDRQRAFIAALAETGSVKAAAKRINMSPEGAYYLRRSPGAEEFAAAWNDALDAGVQSLVDIAIDRARDGVAVPVFWKGEQVGERRWYNDRLLMFILRHHQPHKYGALAALPPGTKHPDTIAREEREAEALAVAATQAEEAESNRLNAELLRRYQLKVITERRHRLAGEVVAADYTLRQLTHIELVLDIGGEADRLIEHACGYDTRGVKISPDPEPIASEISTLLAAIRQDVWDKLGDPPRPSVRRPRNVREEPRQETRGEREAVQRAAEKRIAEAQAEWEAAATEEGWRVWCGG